MASGRVLVVVPTYDERENVGGLIRDLLAVDPLLDVWIADDGSPDGTADVVRACCADHPGRVQLLSRAHKRGRGSAVLAAFERGLAAPRRYERFVEMDADYSHHPRDVPRLLEALRGWDVVVGSRYLPGGGTSDWSRTRAALSWLANRYVALVAGLPGSDTTSGFRGYRREVLEATEFERIHINGYVVHGEMAYQAWIHGFRLGEVPIHFRNRARAASKLTPAELVMAVLNFASLRVRYGARPRARVGREAARAEPTASVRS